MATTQHNDAESTEQDLLATLRADADRRPERDTGVIEHGLGIADRQAMRLSELLTVPLERIETRLVELMPELVITYEKNIPWRGTSFRSSDGDWHIHVRSTDREAVRIFTVLRELKFIIDRPDIPPYAESSRGGMSATLADHFAQQVLAYRAETVES